MSAPNSQKATIPSYQDIAQATFGALWPEATPQDWALVVQKMREALRAQQDGPSERDAVVDTAMAWYDFTLREGLDEHDYRGESRACWLACRALKNAAPQGPATARPGTGSSEDPGLSFRESVSGCGNRNEPTEPCGAAPSEAGADDGQLSRQDKFTMVHNLLNRVDSLLAEARFAQDSSVRHQLKIAKSILRDAEHG